MRLIDADAMMEKYNDWYTEDGEPNGVICTVGCLLRKEPTVGGWISVKKRLPEKTGDYLVFTRGGVIWPYFFTGGTWFNFDGYKTEDVTHWMPLPEPPEEVIQNA